MASTNAVTSAPLPEFRSDLLAGFKQGVLWAFAALVLVLPPPRHQMAQPLAPPQAQASVLPARFHGADFQEHVASADARFIADWVADSKNSRGSPFAILDKKDARVFVFRPDGRLIDSSPVLLGAAPGDDPVVGIGQRPIAQVRQDEKTTPAGRFISQPGRNATGEEVVWVDYADSVSMHRVRPIDPKERRLERLASPDPAERRISYGCINVPVAFFESVVWPVLGRAHAVVYVLPEVRDVHQVFAGAYGRGMKTARSGAEAAPL